MFYIADLFFTRLDCMITSTICRDEPKFYLNLVNFDVVVYVTHSVNAINIICEKI